MKHERTLVQQVLDQSWLKALVSKYLVDGYRDDSLEVIRYAYVRDHAFPDWGADWAGLAGKDAVFTLDKEDPTAVLVNLVTDSMRMGDIFWRGDMAYWQLQDPAWVKEGKFFAVRTVWILLFRDDLPEQNQVLTIVQRIAGPDGAFLEEASRKREKMLKTKLVRLQDGLPDEPEYAGLMQGLKAVFGWHEGSADQRLRRLKDLGCHPNEEDAGILKQYWRMMEE